MNTLDPIKKKQILESLVTLCKDYSMSEVARKLKITPSSVRWHGVEQLGLKFKRERWSTKKIVIPEGKYFNEAARENWLV